MIALLNKHEFFFPISTFGWNEKKGFKENKIVTRKKGKMFKKV